MLLRFRKAAGLPNRLGIIWLIPPSIDEKVLSDHFLELDPGDTFVRALLVELVGWSPV
jgi:hypothetical protein